MSTRPEIRPIQVITNGDMSGSLTSLVTVIPKISMLSYSFSWAGTSPVGTLKVQVSNDYALNADGTVQAAGTWNTLTFSLNGSAVSSAPVSGNSGVGFIDIGQTGAYAVRTLYTFTSGVGTLQAWLNGKVA